MTEDYKKNLLDYFTGDLETGTPTTDEIIKEQMELNRSEWTSYIPSGWVDFHFEDILKDKKSDKYILYGGYRGRESTSVDDEVYGIIILLDENLKPYKAYYEYDSGTKLRSILLMNQADDGTFYMLDDTSFTNYRSESVNNNPRFVMLNNFVTEDKVKLRTSYYLPFRTNEDISYWFHFRKLEKNPNEPQYIIITEYQKFNTHGSESGGLLSWFSGVCCIEFTIPYGESPSWNWIEIAKGKSSAEESLSTGYYRSAFIKFNEDKFLVKAVCSSEENSVDAYRYYFKNYNDNTFTSTIIKTLTAEEIQTLFARYILEQQEIFINENECYFVASNLEAYTSLPGIIKLYHYDITNNELDEIYSNTYPAPASQSYNRKEAIFLAQNEGKLYIQHLVCTGETHESHQYNYYFQRYEGTWDPILVGENQLCITFQRAFYVNNEYNLLTAFLYPNNPRGQTWYFKILKEVYNQNQYNGEPYISVDSLVPKYVNLYSDNSIVFSRNVYNVTKQNNTSMSSVEIPNTSLNNLTISENDLISVTNLEMNSNSTHWNKNIYEVVDLNFINTISIKDEDTNTQYVNGAIRLNNAITDGGASNYTNSPCIKYRINYMDDTTDTGSISWINISEMEKETTFNISVSKAIKDINLTSYDGNTIYLTILGTFEVGKNYRINQKVRIGSKSSEQDLVYNGEDIFYDGEQVKVYIN